MANLKTEIAQKLGSKLFKNTGQSAGGCISSGNVYETDFGKVFVKKNDKPGSSVMFNGELHGLEALKAAGFQVPKPFFCGKNYIVLEYKDIKCLSKYSEALGKNLADLHMGKTTDISKIGTGAVEPKFWYHTTTCCGFLPMCNDWQDDWVLFYSSQRIDPLVRRLLSGGGDRELNEQWSELQLKIPTFFREIQVTPSLLHGDLWSGNAGETEEGPITFDPATFYGHDEFDLAIATMFGGFSRKFFDSYHKIIPKRPGFKERHDLYLLFHNLNHWAHFGDGYRGSSLSLMKTLNRKG